MNLAIDLYQRAADTNYNLALFNLGLCYEYGKGRLAPDRDRAIQLYRRSAELGYPLARD